MSTNCKIFISLTLIWINFLVIIPLHAYTKEIKGIIKEISSGSPLQNITIAIKGTPYYSTSNSDGEFNMNIPDTLTQIVFAIEGMRIVETKIDLTERYIISVKPYTLDDLLELSLEELSKLTVSVASMVDIELGQNPMPITIISKDMISTTPAKNLIDILEIYVPGLVYSLHDAPRLGIRGIMIDREYKYLMLVNGKVMNQHTSKGNTLEVLNWDMEDIQRIEVVRGPGSVTYGAGAISGVINIITKNANTSEGLKIHSSNNITYNSYGGGASYGFNKKNIKAFFYGSYTQTEGYHNSHYFKTIETGEFGFLGFDLNPDKKASNLYQDVLGIPQKKAIIDIQLYENWRFYSRYTNSSAVSFISTLEQVTDGKGNNIPNRFQTMQSALAMLENKKKLGKGAVLKSCISFDSEDFFSSRINNAKLAYNEGVLGDKRNSGNVIDNFSESELFCNSTLNFKIKEKHKISVGVEYSHEQVAGRWDSSDIVILEYRGRNKIINHDTIYYLDIVKDGYKTDYYSGMTEAYIHLSSSTGLLASVRVDKNIWSRYLFSPRLAIFSKWNSKNTLSMVTQQSSRMNITSEMIIGNYFGDINIPEKLQSIEFAHKYSPNSFFNIETRIYYNQIQILGWDHSTIQTYPLGNLKLSGIELDGKYRFQKIDFGFNHSSIGLIKWKNAEGIQVQAISYSDYNVEVDSSGNNLLSTGKSLTNIPQHISKFQLNYRISKHFSFHTSGIAFWTFSGIKAGIDIYSKKYGNSDSTWNTIKARLDKEGIGKTQLIWNASMDYHFSLYKTNITTSLQAYNILGYNRYRYNGGENFNYPSKLAFYKEPTTLTIKLKVEF